MLLAKWVFVLFIYYGAALWGKEIHNHRWRYSVNVPANWLPEAGEDSHRRQVFRSPERRLRLEIEAWERREIASLDTMYRSHLRELQGSGVVSRYHHLGYEVLLARLDYSSPPTKEQNAEHNTVAYVFYFYGAQYAYRASSSGPRDATPLERDIQHSALDSFGFEGHNHWNMGPVASFFAQLEVPQEPVWLTWQLGNHSLRLRQRLEEKVAEKILQREKGILNATTSLYPHALARFYYMNFRHNYDSLKDFALFLQRQYRLRRKKKKKEKKRKKKRKIND